MNSFFLKINLRFMNDIRSQTVFHFLKDNEMFRKLAPFLIGWNDGLNRLGELL